MKEKIPSKITGFFISVIGTGILLRTLSTIIDKLFFSNSDFNISESQNFGLVIFLMSLTMGIIWLLNVRKLS
ncbi:MAG: hypothetical protein P8J65_02325 [Candidatus Actinomarina sp.]|nr:hypothetical protein [Candidatus Actinomarina sp.]MDG1740361.1 hypothetical protein [Candidatus Actinomarina sp.]MDG2082608.1 hypothetical protein [Candidatus Actinomarina sp.]